MASPMGGASPLTTPLLTIFVVFVDQSLHQRSLLKPEDECREAGVSPQKFHCVNQWVGPVGFLVSFTHIKSNSSQCPYCGAGSGHVGFRGPSHEDCVFCVDRLAARPQLFVSVLHIRRDVCEVFCFVDRCHARRTGWCFFLWWLWIVAVIFVKFRMGSQSGRVHGSRMQRSVANAHRAL
jgi:hypothetical protein